MAFLRKLIRLGGLTRWFDAARRENAEAEGSARGVAVAHRNPRRVDAEFLGGDLRQRRFEVLAVRLEPTISATEPSVRMRAEQLSKAE